MCAHHHDAQSIRSIHRFWIMLHASRKQREALEAGVQPDLARGHSTASVASVVGGSDALSTFQISDALKVVANESAKAQAA